MQHGWVCLVKWMAFNQSNPVEPVYVIAQTRQSKGHTSGFHPFPSKRTEWLSIGLPYAEWNPPINQPLFIQMGVPLVLVGKQTTLGGDPTGLQSSVSWAKDRILGTKSQEGVYLVVPTGALNTCLVFCWQNRPPRKQHITRCQSACDIGTKDVTHRRQLVKTSR